MTDNHRWQAVPTWRRTRKLPSPSRQPADRPPAQHHPITLEVGDLSNKFSLLAQLGAWEPVAAATSSSSSASDDTTTAPLITRPHSSPPPYSTAPTRALVPNSKRLAPHELTPTRIIYVRNPTNERSWRGHPGIILSVRAPNLAHVITLTTWKGKDCVQKWSNAEDPARFRRWFLLMDNGYTPNHDGLPVMVLRDGKKMPRICYVDCKRTHWLEVGELEKFRSGGGETEYFVTGESLGALVGHLAWLEGVETPWVEGAGEEPWE